MGGLLVRHNLSSWTLGFLTPVKPNGIDVSCGSSNIRLVPSSSLETGQPKGVYGSLASQPIVRHHRPVFFGSGTGFSAWAFIIQVSY